ncbi:MAG: endonuclease V [Candidatus Thorarchaeota archaeon]
MKPNIDDGFVEALKRKQIQRAHQVINTDMPEFTGDIVTGIDVAYSENCASACAVTYDLSSSKIISVRTGEYVVETPYIPGLFQLREGPILVDMLKNMEGTGPVLIDANGILHPRWFGLASYVGVELDLQTIGVAKKLLVGQIGKRIDDRAVIEVDHKTAGMAVWLEGRNKPVYVSIGHRISLETAVRMVERCSRHGQVVPLQQAHNCANRELRKNR